MKETLSNLYRLNAIAFVRLGEKSFRVKTSQGDFILRYVDTDSMETAYDRISSLRLDGLFVIPLRNTMGHYISVYENHFFEIQPWFENDFVQAKDVRLRYFLKRLAELHQRSYYVLKVNESFFSETYEFIEKILTDSQEQLDSNIRFIEQQDYKSPSQWLFINQFPNFKKALEDAKKHLDNFKKLTADKKSLRISLVYLNFAYDHVLPRADKILSTHHMTMAPLIYDLKDLFDKAYRGSIDLSGHIDEYLQRFKLLAEEKAWLKSLILIPQFDFSGFHEVDRIVQLTNTIHHLHAARDVEKLLEEKDDKKQEDNVKSE